MRKGNSHFAFDKIFYFSKSYSLLKAFPSDRYHFSFLPSILLHNLNSLRLTLSKSLLFAWCSPVIIPLLSEGYLDTKLHLDIVNLLETSHEQIYKNCCGPVWLSEVSPVLSILSHSSSFWSKKPTKWFSFLIKIPSSKMPFLFRTEPEALLS